LDYDPAARRVTVQPGLVLDRLNARLKSDGLFFPVDVSTGSRATLGGMTGNNSAGARSIRYGIMKHNVEAIDAVMADGETRHFGPLPGNLEGFEAEPGFVELVQKLRGIAERERGEIETRIPKLLRRVGGYNIDSLLKDRHNLAELLVGSEGTLAFFQRLTLPLQELPSHRVLGVCHFPDFHQAMDSAQHIVKLDPTAVELVDRNILELARKIPLFQESMTKFLRGEPECLLLVEFAGEDSAVLRERLDALDDLMAELGLAGSVVRATEPGLQQEVWEIRKAGLNIVMAMKGDGKPVSFIEDCAVPLEHLADYTAALNKIFDRHGTRGTWYAHASVGCLHVRPILNLKQEAGARTLRAIAEETLDLVAQYKGTHSGEHGDGLARSEWHERVFGPRIVGALEKVKDSFDPRGVFNPGKIVRPPRMDDRSLFRFKPGYANEGPAETALDWSVWGGFLGAVEMCNNNGACRKLAGGVMCPSYRVTGDEKDVTRGRANTLRLALTGQLGRDALTSPEMRETLDLCVGCKGCRRECPTGVDMARMKIETMAQLRKSQPLSIRDRLVAHLPRYAPWAARAAPLLNLAGRLPGSGVLRERLLGFARQRSLPRWSPRPFHRTETGNTGAGREVALFADTFNTYFEPENARAALAVLRAAGYRVTVASAPEGGRPLCCGRTYLAAGLVEEARAEADRLVAALGPLAERGVPIIGLEPSCLLTLRDELAAISDAPQVAAIARQAKLLEEFLAEEHEAGRLDLDLKPLPQRRVLLHGHCHQKAFGAFAPVERVLRLVPDLEVNSVESSCCGMAGAFGYEAEHYDISMRMGELSLLPAVREADADTLVVADGTSCRHQIHDGAGREAVHVARVLERALAETAGEL
jgi:FAD/FMN-containing dehydrogenase/Fe-S oxidoreductase